MIFICSPWCPLSLRDYGIIIVHHVVPSQHGWFSPKPHNWHSMVHSWRSLQLRHNEHQGISNHQLHGRLLNHLFKVLIKENITAMHHWPLWGNSLVISEFPTQRASNTENVSIWWHHHGNIGCLLGIHSLMFVVIFSCDQAAIWLVQSVRPSVRLSVRHPVV